MLELRLIRLRPRRLQLLQLSFGGYLNSTTSRAQTSLAMTLRRATAGPAERVALTAFLAYHTRKQQSLHGCKPRFE